MPNPWLSIPLADYESHMRAPGVGQLDVLAELFGEVMRRFRPRSLAVLGTGGGTGFEHIDPARTTRVVGLDVNPEYLEAVRRRFGGACNLELHCLDLAVWQAAIEPVELVHAGLVFEHAGTGRCLENALALVAPGGCFSVVLQLPGEAGQDVAATPVASIQSVRPHFSLVDRAWFGKALEARGLRLVWETQRPLPAGKGFWAAVWSR